MSSASSGSRAPSTITSGGSAAAPPARLDPRRRLAPEGDAHRHVGGLAGRRAAAVVDVDVAVDVRHAGRPGRRRAARPARPARACSSRRARAAARRRRPGRAPRSGTARVTPSTSSIPITPVAGSRASERMRTSRSPASRAPSRSTSPASRSAAGASSVPPARPTESIGTPSTVHMGRTYRCGPGQPGGGGPRLGRRPGTSARSRSRTRRPRRARRSRPARAARRRRRSRRPDSGAT